LATLAVQIGPSSVPSVTSVVQKPLDPRRIAGLNFKRTFLRKPIWPF